MKKLLITLLSFLLFYLMFAKTQKEFRPGDYEEMER